MDAAWVRLFRSERRMREQAVPVVRAGTVRAALVTTSMWQRGGCKDAPENNLELPSRPLASCVTALTPRLSWAVTHAIAGVTAHDNAVSYKSARNAGKNEPAETDVTSWHGS